MSHIYFDHNATTPLDERVLAAMLPYLKDQHGNASSRHEFGTVARKAVDEAQTAARAYNNRAGRGAGGRAAGASDFYRRWH